MKFLEQYFVEKSEWDIEIESEQINSGESGKGFFNKSHTKSFF